MINTRREVRDAVLDLERHLGGDVLRGREALRRFLKDGRVELEPRSDKTYIARTEMLPLMLFTESPGAGRGPEDGSVYRLGCAGVQHSVDNGADAADRSAARGVMAPPRHPSSGTGG